MSDTDYTDEGLTAFEMQEGDTEPSTQANRPSIEDSLSKVLENDRKAFHEVLEHISRTPAFCEHRDSLVREAKRLAQRVQDTQSILSRRHWQEFADPSEDCTLRFW